MTNQILISFSKRKIRKSSIGFLDGARVGNRNKSAKPSPITTPSPSWIKIPSGNPRAVMFQVIHPMPASGR